MTPTNRNGSMSRSGLKASVVLTEETFSSSVGATQPTVRDTAATTRQAIRFIKFLPVMFRGHPHRGSPTSHAFSTRNGGQVTVMGKAVSSRLFPVSYWDLRVVPSIP